MKVWKESEEGRKRGRETGRKGWSSEESTVIINEGLLVTLGTPVETPPPDTSPSQVAALSQGKGKDVFSP